MLNGYYTTKHSLKSIYIQIHDYILTHVYTLNVVHIDTLIHDYTDCCLCQAGDGLPSLIKALTNVYHKIECSQKSSYKSLHTCTPIYHYYNYQRYTPHICRLICDKKHKHAINTNISTFLHSSYNSSKPILLVNLYYLDSKYLICYPPFSPIQNVEFIRVYLYFLDPVPLIFIPAFYPSCNPESNNLTCLNG